MIMKLLLLVTVIAAVYFIFFKPKKPVEKASAKPGKSETKKEGDDMVACVKCGTYTSVDEALISNGKYYCSQECLNS